MLYSNIVFREHPFSNYAKSGGRVSYILALFKVKGGEGSKLLESNLFCVITKWIPPYLNDTVVLSTGIGFLQSMLQIMFRALENFLYCFRRST